ncbi:MAG: hypothetical protein MUP58_00575 [Candidatus Nanohaloarchaeota archaeon QJJ-9]|nr:hypothetical protein [Candidatus Nanohaloarchaeota archaeon QJJ-9]
MPEQEKVGYHKGALETLVKEKKELSKMLQIVDSLIENHANALKDEGVDIEEYLDKIGRKMGEKQKKGGNMDKQDDKSQHFKQREESQEENDWLE